MSHSSRSSHGRSGLAGKRRGHRRRLVTIAGVAVGMEIAVLWARGYRFGGRVVVYGTNSNCSLRYEAIRFNMKVVMPPLVGGIGPTRRMRGRWS